MNQRETAKILDVLQAAVSPVLRNSQISRVPAEKKRTVIASLQENDFFNAAGIKRTRTHADSGSPPAKIAAEVLLLSIADPERKHGRINC